MRRLILSLVALLVCSSVATGQTKLAPGGRQVCRETAAVELPERKPAKPPEPKSDKLPGARELFGSVPGPAPLAARSIGFYSKGCLAGGLPLPLNGPDWQVMRTSRNRNWGSPQLVDYLERLASDARAFDGWPGLLVGDMSQPRGGPMLTGHTSHQVGLDADIWLTPMPDHILTPQEREDMTAVSMLKDPLHVDPAKFTLCRSSSSSARHHTRKWRASSCIRRSRRRYASAQQTWARTDPGSPRSGRGGTTTIISTSASSVRPAWRAARISSR